MTIPGSKRPGSGPTGAQAARRTSSGSLPAVRRTASGEMMAISAGQPSSGEFRSANPEGDAFRPLLELGRGGMARVYLAEKTSRGLRRLVVLKVLEPTLATDPEMRALFRREAEVCARLHHPNVVQVFEVVDEEAAPFMVMEYVEGVSLSQVLARTEQRLPTRLHVHILMQVLAGLQYFHELKDEEGNPLHGVHRDVSPQNVIVMHEGAVKVLDFGIAKVRGGTQSGDVTRAGIIKGKLSYMPPEQLIGDASIDRRADIFAVGVMLWEAFARRRLWQGWEQQNMMKALVSGTMPSIREACPWISKGMEEVITKAIAAKREQRYQTALELQVALEDCMGELGGAVQQREIQSFMETEFGEWRRDRQRSVDAEIRKPAVALDTVLEVSEIEEIAVESEMLLLQGHVSSSVQAMPVRRRWLAPVLALGVAAAAALVLLSWRWTSQRDAMKPIVPASSLDPRAVSPLPASPAPASAQRPEPDDAQSPAAAANAAPSASAGEGKRPRGSAKGAPAARKFVPPTAAAPAAAPQRNCTPPYVLDAEGVKTYKPECL